MTINCHECSREIKLSRWEELMISDSPIFNYKIADTRIQKDLETSLDYIYQDYKMYPEKYSYGEP